MKNQFVKYGLLIIIFTNVISNSKAQPIQDDVLSEAKLDSVVHAIVISDDIDSVKISKISKQVSRHRYATYTFEAIKRIREMAATSGSVILMADSYRILGNYYFYNSKLDSAELFLLKARDIVSKIHNPFFNIRVRNSLGGVYRKKGDISKAIETILESRAILDEAMKSDAFSSNKSEIVNQQIIVHNTLANFYNQMGDEDRAIEYYDLAFKKAMSVNSVVSAGVVLSNKGDLLLNINNNREALNVLNEAIDLKIKGKAGGSSISNTEQNIALALFKLHEYDNALEYINNALGYYQKMKLMRGLMESLIIRGNIYLGKGESIKSIADCNRAKRLAIKAGVLENQEKSCLCLYKAFKLMGNYEQALSNYEMYMNAKDSIFNTNNIKEITRLEMQYNYDREKDKQKIINDVKDEKNKRIIRLLIAGLLVLIVIAGLYYRLSSVNRRSSMQLAEKNSIISDALAVNETLLKETHHRVKNNLQIVSSLLSMQNRFLDDDKSKAIVTDSQNRIESMSLIHKKLYQDGNLTGIETGSYFTDLLDSLVLSYGIDKDKVDLDISVENLLLDVDTIMPLGLIVNEMISNSFKYGVDKETGYLKFSFTKSSDKELLIVLQDNGPGIPDDFETKSVKSYGMKLIQSLSKKLKADIVYENSNGFKTIMTVHRFKMA